MRPLKTVKASRAIRHASGGNAAFHCRSVQQSRAGSGPRARPLSMRRPTPAAMRSSSSSSRSTRMFAPEILARSEKHRAREEWELPLAHLAPLAERCRARKILFSCTPFYLEAVAELAPLRRFLQDRLLRTAGDAAARSLRGQRQARGAVHRHGDDGRNRGRRRHPEARRRQRHHPAALRLGLSDAGRRRQSFRHRGHSRGHGLRGRLVRSHAQARRDRARRASLGRGGGGIPSRSRRRRRRIRRRPLLAAGRNRPGHRAHPRERGRRRHGPESFAAVRSRRPRVAGRSQRWDAPAAFMSGKHGRARHERS